MPLLHRAKSLLDDKGVPYEEIDVTNPELRTAMVERAHGRRTVPQISSATPMSAAMTTWRRSDRRGPLDPLLA